MWLASSFSDCYVRAMRRLEAARAQKEIPEATKAIRQQELHKSLRVTRTANFLNTTTFVVWWRDDNSASSSPPAESQQLLQSDRWWSANQLLPFQPWLQNARHGFLVPTPPTQTLACTELVYSWEELRTSGAALAFILLAVIFLLAAHISMLNYTLQLHVLVWCWC